MAVFGDYEPADSYDTDDLDDGAVLRIWSWLRLIHDEDISLLMLIARLRREGTIR